MGPYSILGNVETKLTLQTVTIAPDCNIAVVCLKPLAPSAWSGALPNVLYEIVF